MELTQDDAKVIGLGKVLYKGKIYRIRNLTPRECGRFMGVPDEKIDRLEAIHCNSTLYKQFGNSIVVNVMEEMFKRLF